MIVDRGRLALSDEHLELAWLDVDAAIERLTFDSNRTAVWELHQRLVREAGTS